MTIKALALFSGGLDSILACRVIAQQGIDILAVKFISPFFDYHLLDSDYCEKTRLKYGVEVKLIDISQEYIGLLRLPAHGYGKHFNPCIDCKIFMMKRARELMGDLGAAFLFSGEVVGQRPMSQRADALRVVERDSGCDGILLRPLCAKKMEPTKVELEGLVDRQQLGDLSGRSRSGQMALAKDFGITDYPTPAGGCILTDPVVGERIKRFYAENDTVTIADMRLIMVGRQFQLPGGAWLVMGRKEAENVFIEELAQPDDIVLKLDDRPGPLAVLRFKTSEDDLSIAAGLVARYGKKDNNGKPYSGAVLCSSADDEQILEGIPPIEDSIASWQF